MASHRIRFVPGSVVVLIVECGWSFRNVEWDHHGYA